MYKNRKHSVPDRIVSIEQPHVRPIVRGKAKINLIIALLFTIYNSKLS
jgi:IS5 family transposase